MTERSADHQYIGTQQDALEEMRVLEEEIINLSRAFIEKISSLDMQGAGELLKQTESDISQIRNLQHKILNQKSKLKKE